MRPIVTDQLAWSVGLSVGLSVCLSVTLVIPAKTAATIEMSFGLGTRVGPRNHVLDGGPDLPWEGKFWGRKRRPIVKYRDTLQSSVQKRLNRSRCRFGLWAWMGPRNHVLDRSPAVLRDVAMATTFGTQFAITGFVGYNFGCLIRSDTLFDCRVGFWGQAIRWRHSRDRASKGRCHGNYVKLLWPLVMVALCNRAKHYIFILWLLLSSFFLA